MEQPIEQTSDPNEQMQVRLDKLPAIRTTGRLPYTERFERTHRLHEAALLPDTTAKVRVAGRIIALRYFGKLAFGHLYDLNGKLQFALQKNKLGNLFDDFRKLIDIGDFIGVAHAAGQTTHNSPRHRGVAGDDLVQGFRTDFNEAAI